MRLSFALLLLVLSSVSLFAQGKKNKKAPQHRVVIQLSNGDSLTHYGLMNNLQNLRQGWPELKIAVVCHGPGMKLLHTDKSQFLKEVALYTEQGVEFVACRNTMKTKNIPEEKVFAKAKRVDMGLKEVIERQEQGWTYLKAGVTGN
jgi:intracellular sulfur oxidation DsrE/DsrF family protein